MTSAQAFALAERAASHTRRCEMDAELKPSAANLARLSRAEASERAAWQRAQAVQSAEELDWRDDGR